MRPIYLTVGLSFAAVGIVCELLELAFGRANEVCTGVAFACAWRV